MANQLHCASCGTLTDRAALSPYRGWCAACRERGGPPQPAASEAALRAALLAYEDWLAAHWVLLRSERAVDAFLAAWQAHETEATG